MCSCQHYKFPAPPVLLDFESQKVLFLKDLVSEITLGHIGWPKSLQSTWASFTCFTYFIFVFEIHWNLTFHTWKLLEQGIDLKTDWQA